jgi:hypothetical protein
MPGDCGGTVTETWTATDACGRTLAPVSRTVTVNPAALPTIQAPPNITVSCGGLPAATTLTFSNVKCGGCLITGTSDLSTFSAMPGTCGGIVTETWTAKDACGRSLAPVSRTVTVNPATLPTMKAPANITVTCEGLPAATTLTFSNGLSGRCLITGTSNLSTFSEMPGAFGGTVTETWTAKDACGRVLIPVSRTVTIIPPATPPSSVSAAQTSICQGESTTLSYIGGSGSIFRWYSGSCGSTLVGSGNNLPVTPTSTSTYYGRWETGCGNSSCFSVTIAINPLPGATIIDGPAEVCKDGTESITASALNTSSYTWTFPTSWIINSGQGTSSIDVKVGNNSGDICVLPLNNCGSGLLSCKTITVKSKPEKPSEIIGEINPQINSTYNYLVDPLSDADNYIWSASGGTLNSSQNSATITWTVLGNQSIAVKAENECGESDQMSSLEVVVKELPSDIPVNLENGFEIYPNPAKDHLVIKFPNKEERKYIISLVDLSGKVVLINEINEMNANGEIKLDISAISYGTYMLYINNLSIIRIEHIIKE